MTIDTTTTRGLLLPCPLCGEAEAQVLLDLSDMDTCHCDSCDTDFSLTDLAGRIAKWHRLLTWVEAAPGAEGGAS